MLYTLRELEVAIYRHVDNMLLKSQAKRAELLSMKINLAFEKNEQ